MARTFALFPLQMVVFPGEKLNLHIFEDRYRELVQDAETDGTTWLIPTVIEGTMRPIATEVTLTDVAMRYPSGESDVHTVGGKVYLLEGVSGTFPGKLYPGGEASELDVEMAEDPALNKEIIALALDIYDRLGIDKRISTVENGFRTYDIGHYVGLSLEQEYELLTLRSALPRQRFLLHHLKEILPSVALKSSIRERADLNGHFKELVPPDF